MPLERHFKPRWLTFRYLLMNNLGTHKAKARFMFVFLSNRQKITFLNYNDCYVSMYKQNLSCLLLFHFKETWSIKIWYAKLHTMA